MSTRKCSRVLLLTINVIFILASLVAISGGAVIYVIGNQYNLTPTVAIGLIVLAGISGVISLHGFIATLKRSKRGLMFYYSFLLLIIGCQISVGVIAFVVQEYMDEILSKIWHNELSDQSKNLLQLNFGCCGFYDLSDAPGSICSAERSCQWTLSDFMNSYSMYVYIGAFGLLGVEILIVSLTAILNGVQRMKNRIEEENATLNRPPRLQINDLTVFRENQKA